jgi:GLPGLI family protein
VLEKLPIDENKGDKSNKFIELVNNSLDNKLYVLEANSSGYLFTEKNMMQEEKEKLISKLTNSIYLIYNHYYNLQQKKTYKILDDILVESNTQFNWELSSESKKIDNFNCYKAICTISYLSKDGNKSNRVVTAWYCPEIRFNYGPNGFAGLPGLILELEYNKTKLVAKEIKLIQEEITINPPKEKIVTEKSL